MPIQHPNDLHTPLQLGSHWKDKLPEQPHQIYSPGLLTWIIRLVIFLIFAGIIGATVFSLMKGTFGKRRADGPRAAVAVTAHFDAPRQVRP